MSFEWNSDDGEEDFSSWGMNGGSGKNGSTPNDAAGLDDNTTDDILTSMNDFDNPNVFASANQGMDEDDDGDDDDDDGDDSVDWEDADQDGEESGNRAEPDDQLPKGLQAVTIDLNKSKKNEKPPNNKKGRKRRRRNVWKAAQLPHDLQRNLKECQRAHLLAWISHVRFMASDSILNLTEVACAVSFVPRIFWSEESGSGPPSIQLIRDFCTWYTSWLSEHLRPPPSRRGRRRGPPVARQGTALTTQNQQSNREAPKTLDKDFADWIKAVLSPDLGCIARKSPHRSLFTNLLGYALLRQALGLRVRWCMALKEVISLDLNVNHPWLLSATKNVFVAASSSVASKATKIKHGKQSRTRLNPSENSQMMSHHGPPPFVFGWMELLAEEEKLRQADKSNMRWLHLDLAPNQSISSFSLDHPQAMESRLADLEHATTPINDESPTIPSLQPPAAFQKRRKRKRPGQSGSSPVAYVLAVEHRTGSAPTRFVDVTPRYAESRVGTLQQRGLSRLEIQNELSYPAPKDSSWWAQTLSKLSHRGNSTDRSTDRALSNSAPNGRTSFTDAILLDTNTVEEDSKPEARIVTNEKQKITPPNSCHNGKKLFAEDGEELDRKIPPARSLAEGEDEDEISFSDDATKEPMPKSKSGFAKHPIYVLKSQLGKTHVLSPTASVCGLFAGESVYLRRDVSVALEAKAWLYQGRKVKESLVSSPLIRLKPRKKAANKKGFVALSSYGVGAGNDGSEKQRVTEEAAASIPLDKLDEQKERLLYGRWQTDKWSPPYVGPQDPIPLNGHNNVELALLNPGLVHIDIPIAAVQVAKQLDVPYAPCLLGFNSSQGTPIIRGIVVHEVHSEMIQHGAQEINHYKAEKQGRERQRLIKKSWKKLMSSILVKRRLDREYGDVHKGDDDNDNGMIEIPSDTD